MKKRYAVDNTNLLIVKRNRENLLVNGKFSIDRNNQLIYWLNEPAPWRKTYNLPNKIVFAGNWRPNPNYDLELNLDETKDQFKGERLIIKGKIISADRDALVFEVKSYDKQGLLHIQLLNLSGSWQADEYNQITFAVKKKTAPDILTLEGIWQINKNQQIAYTYEKTDLKRKTKICNTLAFTGFWEINSSNRLTYILSRSSQSRFDFHFQAETPNLYPREGVIKYRLGIGISKERRSQTCVISLYGTWKFSRKLGLVFQMDYSQGEIHNLEFGTDISLSQKDKITFFLKNKRGEPLGLEITFTHRFLEKLDAEAFLRLKERLREESAIEAGIRIPF